MCIRDRLTASRFNGIPVKRYMLASFIVSGAIASLGGGAELLGTQFRLINGYGAGYGFDGVAIDVYKRQMRWCAKVVSVLDLEPGESVSYGRIYKTTGHEKIAVISACLLYTSPDLCPGR